MSEEEFKEYVKETLSNINSKITKKEQGFINLLGNTFNDVCVENIQLKSVLKEIREKINFYKTTEWGLRGYSILETFEEIIDKVGIGDK